MKTVKCTFGLCDENAVRFCIPLDILASGAFYLARCPSHRILDELAVKKFYKEVDLNEYVVSLIMSQ